MYWFFYSIIATLLLGTAMSLYKIPSFKNYSSFFSTFWTNFFSVLIIFISLFIWNIKYIPNLINISWYAVMWGFGFTITMVLQKILLKDVETNSAYPVTASLGSIITVLIGLTVLSESITLIQSLGIIIVLISAFLFTKKGGSFPLNQKVVLLSLGIISSSTFSKYVQKLGAINDPIQNFVFWQYIGATLLAFFIAYIFEKNNFKEILYIKKYWKGSLLISFFTVAGGYFIVKALSVGPLSGVYSIHPAYTFVAGIFGWIFFKEKLTKRKMILILLSIVGIIFIKIG